MCLFLRRLLSLLQTVKQQRIKKGEIDRTRTIKFENVSALKVDLVMWIDELVNSCSLISPTDSKVFNHSRGFENLFLST